MSIGDEPCLGYSSWVCCSCLASTVFYTQVLYLHTTPNISTNSAQYAPILFAQTGLPAGTASFLASGVSAILMLAISIPAFLYADRWGRRVSVIVGGIALSSCMFIIGALYASHTVNSHSGGGRWAVIVLIFAFALTYCATWGVVGKIYASEIQPPQTRAAANSAAQGLSFVSHNRNATLQYHIPFQ